MTTINQRAVDLVYAGHGIPEVANITGLKENAIRGLLQDTSQSPTSQGGSPAVGTLTVVSGTAQQDMTKQRSKVYVTVTGAGSGTVAVAIGPDATTANAIIPATDATLSRTVFFDLPANWYFKVTVVTATIASAKQVT